MIDLKDKQIAILATHGFEEIELTGPLEELKSYGATVHIISDEPQIRAWNHGVWSNHYNTDRMLEGAGYKDYDMLILPGGVINTDKLRRKEKAMGFIREFYNTQRPIAAICHGPQLFIEAEVGKGRQMTGHRAIKKDMINAGINYKDYNVITDDNLVTAKGADDVPAFMKSILTALQVYEIQSENQPG